MCVPPRHHHHNPYRPREDEVLLKVLLAVLGQQRDHL
jgi:hypothetical protein